MAKRAFSTALLVAALVLPGTAGHAEERLAANEFQAHFAPVAEAVPAAGITPGAVDLTAIEPALEPEVAATAIGAGVASYYADKFNGRRTASGETFSNRDLTAAHRTLPFGTRLKLTNPSTGASVVVRVNDRGPFHAGRELDVSRAAAERLGLVRRGHGTVQIARLDD